MNQLLELSEAEFDEKYKLVKNHLDDNASFDGNMFETYGEELDYVLEMAKQNRVVTIIEGDAEVEEDGEERPTMYYSSGMHRINCIGYFVTEESITEDFEVKIDW